MTTPRPRGCGSAPPRTPPSTLAHRLPEAGGAPGSAPLRGSAHLRPPAPSSRPFLDPGSAGTPSACAPCASARTQRRTRGTDTLPILQTRSCDGAELPPPGRGRAANRTLGTSRAPGGRRARGRRVTTTAAGPPGSGQRALARPRGSGAKARVEHVHSAQTSLKPSHPAGRDSDSNEAWRTSGASVVARPPRSPPPLRPEPGQRGADLGGATPDRPPPSERMWFLRSRINHRLSNKPPSIRIYNYQTCPAWAPRLRPLRPPRADSGQTWKPPGTQASARTRPRPRSSRRKDQRAEPSIKDLFKLSN